MIDLIKKINDFWIKEILWIYLYWSFMYWTNNENSDKDYLIIVKDEINNSIHYTSNDFDFEIISFTEYKRFIENLDIRSLECYFSDNLYDCKNINYINFSKKDLKINLQVLRKSISSITSNSWVKFKKKIILENEDNYIWYKSLFHVFRILKFWIQLAKNKKIINYKDWNEIWFEIENYINEKKDLKWLITIFQPRYNQLKTEFKKLAPK